MLKFLKAYAPRNIASFTAWLGLLLCLPILVLSVTSASIGILVLLFIHLFCLAGIIYIYRDISLELLYHPEIGDFWRVTLSLASLACQLAIAFMAYEFSSITGNGGLPAAILFLAAVIPYYFFVLSLYLTSWGIRDKLLGKGLLVHPQKPAS